jgi:hypothetical protein
MSEERYFHKVEVLLRQATSATSEAERNRLIDEALHWHNLALEAHSHTAPRELDHDRGFASAG